MAAEITLNGKEDTCDQAKIILNAVGPAPIEVFEAENLIEGSFPSHELIKEASEMAVRVAHPVANIDSTPTYRRKMVGILTQKALTELAKGMIALSRKGMS